MRIMGEYWVGLHYSMFNFNMCPKFLHINEYNLFYTNAWIILSFDTFNIKEREWQADRERQRETTIK